MFYCKCGVHICKINLTFYLELFFNIFEALQRDNVKKYITCCNSLAVVIKSDCSLKVKFD